MLLWRITRASYQALDGEGARVNGGRWNSEGVAVVYTSPTLALAALEYLAHVDPEDVPEDLVAMRIEIPDDFSEDRIQRSDLPADWNTVPDHPACVTRGDAWVKDARTVLLRVPSALVPEEENVLINARHAEAGRIAVEHVRPFVFEPRLLS
ncbi:MAG: RES family NAD+ phosphorylase [Gemmatimonadetes bacterium]|nr:RES family NAD+ phosphorylase [Gemmatimonadota bacterium]